MLAMNYRGPLRVRIDQKPMPEILHPQDAIVRVTRSCICGSDLHLYNGSVPDTRVGMTFGHEFTGVVVELGADVETLQIGDHVLVPFNIACGKCVFCQQGLYGNCHESNAQATAVGGIFGYSHTAGGYDGGQAEYVRVPYADVGPTVIPEGMDPDDAVLLTDVVPTGERPNITAAFGTSTPPSGLSGILRRIAFTYSESSYGHWLPLMLADRVNVVEGVLDDLRRGHIPNIFEELGWKAEWKYNRTNLVGRVLVGATLASAVIVYLHSRKDDAYPACCAPRSANAPNCWGRYRSSCPISS